MIRFRQSCTLLGVLNMKLPENGILHQLAIRINIVALIFSLSRELREREYTHSPDTVAADVDNYQIQTK